MHVERALKCVLTLSLVVLYCDVNQIEIPILHEVEETRRHSEAMGEPSDRRTKRSTMVKVENLVIPSQRTDVVKEEHKKAQQLQ